MRTNNKRLKNIVLNNFDGVELGEARTKGFVVKFDQGLESEHWVRVELVDTSEYYKGQQGIHVKLSSSIEGDLVDALETACKDLFRVIYIHQKPKSSEERRKRRIENVRSWIKKPRFELKHSLSKVYDVDATLESLNEDQVDLLLAFISGIYQSASSESREHWAPKYHNLRRALESMGVDTIKTIDIADGKAVSNE